MAALPDLFCPRDNRSPSTACVLSASISSASRSSGRPRRVITADLLPKSRTGLGVVREAEKEELQILLKPAFHLEAFF